MTQINARSFRPDHNFTIDLSEAMVSSVPYGGAVSGEWKLADISGSWADIMAWMAANSALAPAVWGWEWLAESAAHCHSKRFGGTADGLSVDNTSLAALRDDISFL